VAAHEDGFILRQLVKDAAGARLEGRNTAMRTRPVPLDESVEIFGVVRACTRRLA
jgi:SOS-response transcriptional repressor LexA